MDLIVVPSSGRPSRQQTLYAFAKAGITKSYKVVVAVYEHEVKNYRRMTYKGKVIKGVEVVAVPPEYTGIARKREYICTVLAPKMRARYLMVADDDMWFCRRPKITEAYMPYIHEDSFHMHRMIELLTRWLQMGIAHVGLMSRQANRILDMRWQQPGRQMNVHGYDLGVINKLPIKWSRVPVMEDFDLTLQLLKLGYVNRISCRYAWTTTSNQSGGCSSYRTSEIQAAAARKLAKLHPGCVKLKDKKSKSWKNELTERVDVRVRWLKAYQDSPTKHGYKRRPKPPKDSVPTTRRRL